MNDVGKVLLYLDKQTPYLSSFLEDEHLKGISLYTLKSAKSGLVGFSNSKPLIDFLKDGKTGHDTLFALIRLLETRYTRFTEPIEFQEKDHFYLTIFSTVDYTDPDFLKLEVFGNTVYLFSDIGLFLKALVVEKPIEEFKVIESHCPISIENKNLKFEYLYPSDSGTSYTYFNILGNNDETRLNKNEAEEIIRHYLLSNYDESIKSKYRRLFETKKTIVIWIRKFRDEKLGFDLVELVKSKNDLEYNQLIRSAIFGMDGIKCGITHINGGEKVFYLIHAEDAEFLKTRASLATLIDMDAIITEACVEVNDGNPFPDEYKIELKIVAD